MVDDGGLSSRTDDLQRQYDFLQDFGGKTGFACCSASILSTRCSTSSTKTPMGRQDSEGGRGSRRRVRLRRFQRCIAEGARHELEMKLLLSSTFRGWNVAVNPSLPRTCCRASPGSLRTPSVPAVRSRLRLHPTAVIFAGRISLPGWKCTEAWATHGVPACTTRRITRAVFAWNLPSDWTVRLSSGSA